MRIALDNAAGVNIVTSYEPGEVRIRDRPFTTSLIALPDQLFPDWEHGRPAELRAASLALILEQRPEVLILGTGETQVFPDPASFVPLMDFGIGFEIMDNGAACRTYNILLAEGRRVALALMLADGEQ
jgi:uncharacterized protein